MGPEGRRAYVDVTSIAAAIMMATMDFIVVNAVQCLERFNGKVFIGLLGHGETTYARHPDISFIVKGTFYVQRSPHCCRPRGSLSVVST